MKLSENVKGGEDFGAVLKMSLPIAEMQRFELSKKEISFRLTDEEWVAEVIENLLVFGEVAELQWSMWGLSGQQNLWMETDRESLRVQPPFQVIMPSSINSPSTSYLYLRGGGGICEVSGRIYG